MLSFSNTTSITGNVNSSSSLLSSTLPYQPAFHTSLIVISILATGHNLLVLIIYNRERSLHTKTNFILSNLACCDLLTGCVFLPLMIAVSFFQSKPLQFATNVFADLTVIGVVLSLASVTCERYLNLCRPYQYPVLVTKLRVHLLVAFIWSVAAIMSLVPIAWSHHNFYGDSIKETESFRLAYQVHSLVVLVIFFIIPTLLSLFALISMYCVIRKLTKNDVMVSAEIRRKRERRVVLVFLAMYMCLIICWTPLILVRLTVDFHLPLKWKRWQLELFVCLRGLPSFLNPLIYVWCKEDFRRSILKFKSVRNGNSLHSRMERNTTILMDSLKNGD